LLDEQPDYVLPSEPSTEPLRRLLQYWRSKCVGDRLPGRPDIDPVALAFILPNLFIMDVRADEEPHRRFRFRLFGAELVRVHGRDLTGRTFHDALEPEAADGAVRHAMRVVAERIPLFVAGKMAYLKHKEWLNFENCMLPLQGDSGEVNMILGATVHLFASKGPDVK
jgi:hypothetical protein